MITGEREIISDEVESVIVVNEKEKEELYCILKQGFPYSFYTDSGELLESVFKKLCNLYHLHIATAESCTAGSLSYTITRISGSSSYFDRGFTVYSNKAKHEILGISWGMLNRFGAVSREVALCMAQGALKRSEADIAVSTTGIAGPTGGTAEKPVGLVYFGLATKEKNKVYKKIFTGNREMIRDKATRFALGMMIEFIKKNYER
ncbi:MAG: CinA family protein [Deltaproteobacteria bacterium]|nr:CinA family protein [Deltaproteobacteria bacterium]